MKKNTSPHLLMCISIFCMFSLGTVAQVGIGTSTPNGILDVTSSTNGVVFPRVVLTAANNPLPVVNPNGGVLALGTTVYNTTATTPPTATNNLYEGFYFWNGTRWIPQFELEESQIFEQTSVGQRVPNTPQNITGLTNRTFIPKYSGMYKIEVIMDYGGGQLNNPPSGNIHIIPAQANFNFTFNGTSTTKYINVLSAINLGNAAPHIVNVYKRPTIIMYMLLTAGTSYPFNLSITQIAGNGFVNGGASGTGMGYVGSNGPCSVEFTFVE